MSLVIESLRNEQSETLMSVRMVFLGAPGSGKGTQAGLITQKYGIPQISTGDILREAAKNGSELGRRAADIMGRGDLVPDAMVIGIIEDRLKRSDCQDGFILDGFPRTIPQAEALSDLLHRLGCPLTKVVDFDIPEDRVIERFTLRRTCNTCNAVYNLASKPPKVDGRCDNCGGSLHQREDDREEVVRKRMSVYRNQTEPLKNYYLASGLLNTIQADRPIDQVAEDLERIIRQNGKA